jgi:lipoprotein-releasing system ATP-binding protein
MSEALVLEVRGLAKSYAMPGGSVEVLKGVDMNLRGGESVAVTGVSGVGKSTLLHQLGGLDAPDGGSVRVCGRDIVRMGEEERTAFRAARVGFVFQHHGLLPEFTALENAAMPLLIAGAGMAESLAKAREILEALGLGARLHHLPSELSGGEAQRAALARALARGPELLLADEPTGNLDEKTAREIFDLLSETVRRRGMGMVMATHNQELARRCGRVLRLHGGVLEAAA